MEIMRLLFLGVYKSQLHTGTVRDVWNIWSNYTLFSNISFHVSLSFIYKYALTMLNDI